MSTGTTSPTVRRFEPDEWQLYRDLRLHALEESPESFGSTYAYEVLRSDGEWATRLSRGVLSPRDLPLLAEVNAEPCGLAWVRIEASEPDVAHLYQMWVAPTRRRQGTGRALMNAAVAWAHLAAARTMVLDVTTENLDAVRLYERCGFRPVGDLKPLRPGSHLQSQAMQLSLERSANERSA
jgi:ribosomal protein S18 acetylase RimI-like enzyme